MQSELPTPDSNTPKPTRAIVHRKADPANKENEAYLAKNLSGGHSFRLEIIQAMVNGEFGRRNKGGVTEIIYDACFSIPRKALKNVPPAALTETVANLVDMGIDPVKIGELLHSLNPLDREIPNSS